MKKYKILNVAIALAVILCIAFFVWIYPLSFRELKAKHEISRELVFPVSIFSVYVDKDDVNWQDYSYAYRVCTENYEEEDMDKMLQNGWTKDTLPEELCQHAVFEDYRQDIKYYDEHYECLWIYIDKFYQKYGERAFPGEEYRSINYVFAFYVPERNLLYFVHVCN